MSEGARWLVMAILAGFLIFDMLIEWFRKRTKK